MTASSFCVRCNSPLTAVTPNGLCTVCVANVDATVNKTIAKTIPYHPSNETPTADFLAENRTTPWSGAGANFPDAPAGYELYDSLGPGGMGVVYRAKETATGRFLAIKYPSHLGHPNTRERFQIEVQSLATLNHPNFVRVLSVVLDRTHPYFMMELADGGSLSSRIREHGLPPMPDAVRLIETTARAMHEAHRAGIIHRDLKPSNILLFSPQPATAETPSWSDWVPKIADFGLAKQLHSQQQVTQTGQAMGTPNYMPPEQLRAKENVPHATADVYSLGATLYDLLTGQAPFRYRMRSDMEAIRVQPPKTPRSLNPNIPVALEAIVLKCLEKRPEARYPTAEALADDLARWQRGEKPAAPHVGVLRRTAWLIERNSAVVASLLIAACVVAALVMSLNPTADAGPGPAPPVPFVATPPTDADILAEIHAEVNAGKRVTLLGETGGPRYPLKWLIGGPAPQISDDKPLTFEAIDTAVMQLLPDPGVDRYTLEADLRILVSMSAREPNGNLGPGQFVLDCGGLACGYVRMDDPKRKDIGHEMVALTFNDYLSQQALNVYKEANLKPTPYADFRPFHIYEDRGTLSKSYGNTSGFKRYKDYDYVITLPGEWRRMQMTVTPEQVTATWIDDQALNNGKAIEFERTEFGHATAAEIQARFADGEPRTGIRPAWNPRQPVGIVCRQARIAVKNVVLQSLPKP